MKSSEPPWPAIRSPKTIVFRCHTFMPRDQWVKDYEATPKVLITGGQWESITVVELVQSGFQTNFS